MQQFRVPGLGYRLVLALAGAAVALTAGFAGVTFVRLIGLVVLGRRRRGQAGPGAAAAAADYGWLGRAGDRDPVGRAAWSPPPLPPLEIRVIAAGLSPVVPGVGDHRAR